MISDKRVELNNILKTILPNVYYQPPEKTKLNYPAIIYTRSKIHNIKADDCNFIIRQNFDVTLIDKKADSEFLEKILELDGSSFDRQYISDNLYHFTFNILI